MTPSRQRDVRYFALVLSPTQRVGAHHHAEHQLLRVDSGALAFTHQRATWVIPTGGAVWLPAGLRHELDAIAEASVATLYIRAKSGDGYAAPGPVEMSPLLGELMRTLSQPVSDPTHRRHLELVVRDELTRLAPRSFVVALPFDAAAREVALAVLAEPADDRTLTDLAACVGSSVRTLQRRFREETGLSFQTWRRRAGLQHAMNALERGDNISEVAHQCGFASASSFIAAFRAEVGVTPGAWSRG